jgi:hypothetical protein
VCGGPLDGQTITLTAAKCSIGSGRMRTLRLRRHGVRRMHCLILRGARGTVVRRWSPDTRLNGQSFTDAPLCLGDRLTLGPVELEVTSGKPPEESQPLAALKQNIRVSRLRARTLVRQLRESRELLHQIQRELTEAKQGHFDLQEQLRQMRAASDVVQQQCGERAAELERREAQLETRRAEIEREAARLEESRARDAQQRDLSSQRLRYTQQLEALQRRNDELDSRHRTMLQAPTPDETQDDPRLP